MTKTPPGFINLHKGLLVDDWVVEELTDLWNQHAKLKLSQRQVMKKLNFESIKNVIFQKQYNDSNAGTRKPDPLLSIDMQSDEAIGGNAMKISVEGPGFFINPNIQNVHKNNGVYTAISLAFDNITESQLNRLWNTGEYVYEFPISDRIRAWREGFQSHNVVVRLGNFVID